MRTLAALALIAATTAVLEPARPTLAPDAGSIVPLAPGERVPAFVVRDPRGRAVRLDLADGRPVVAIFFRGGWCPYCNAHLAELRHAEAELAAAGIAVWFFSADRPDRLLSSLDEPDLGYTVYSDAWLDAADAFGVAFRVDDLTASRYRDAGLDLAAASGEDHQGLPVPAVFLVDGAGVVRWSYSDADHSRRLSPEALLAAVEAHLPGA